MAVRLRDEALAEQLRRDRYQAADQAAIVAALTEHTPRLANGQRDWTGAHPYVRAQLARHAAAAGSVDELITDPRFLLAATPDGLTCSFDLVRTPAGRLAARAYRHAKDLVDEAPKRNWPATLQLAARWCGAVDLAEAIGASGLSLPWTTRWAVSGPEKPDLTPTGHEGAVSSVAFGQIDGQTVIVSGSYDCTVRVWNPTTGKQIGEPLTGHTGPLGSVAFGQIDEQTVIASGSDDCTVRVWNPTTGKQIGEPLTGHEGDVSSVTFGQIDGQTVIVSGSYDCTVRVWNPTTGKQIGEPLTGHEGAVSSVAFGQIDEQTVIVSGGFYGEIVVWDAATGKQIGEPLTDPEGLLVELHTVAFGQIDGRTVIVAGSTSSWVRVWDAATRTPVGEPMPLPRMEHMEVMAVGELDGRTVIVSGGWHGQMVVWDAATGAPIGAPMFGYFDDETDGKMRETVESVAIGDVDGRPMIVSGGGAIRGDEYFPMEVWDLAGRPLVGHTTWPTMLAAGQIRGRTVIVSGDEDKTIAWREIGTVWVWDATTGAPIGEPFIDREHLLRSLRTLTVGLVDNRTAIITSSSPEVSIDFEVQAWDATTGAPIGEPFIGHTLWTYVVAVGQVGSRTAIIVGEQNMVSVWDPMAGALIGEPLTGHTNKVESVTIGQVADRTVIASGSADHTVRMWDATTGAPIGEPLTGHTNKVKSVTIGQVADRTVIASGSADHTVRMWDATTGAPIGEPLTGHTNTVNFVTIGELNGQTVIVSGSGETIRIWPIDGRDGIPLPGHAIDLGPVGWPETLADNTIFISAASGVAAIRVPDRTPLSRGTADFDVA